MSKYKKIVNIELAEHGVSFECEADDTLLRSALRNGVNISYECNSGGCGSCKFELVDGEVDVIWEDAPGLSRRDRKKGRLLACQCRPRVDCTIKINLDNQGINIYPKRLPISYEGRRELTHDMAEFHFRSESPAHFRSGQYAMLTLPGIGDRAYSMSNIPNEDGHWQFIIKKMPGGKGTEYLFNQLKVGETLLLDGPYGNAYLRDNNGRDIVLIAGGSGLSPVISIARTISGDSRFAGRKAYLFYGGRGPKDICTPDLVKELEPLAAKLICHNAVSDKELAIQHNWNGPCCFIHELVESELGDSMSQYEYYFCGPPAMTEAVQRLTMIDHKVPFNQIHFDRFF